jgi:hypothetical protein
VTTVHFDPAHQGGPGNYGELFTPIDDAGFLAPLTVTARTAIAPQDPFDLFAAGAPGTVYLSGSGAGVRTQAGLGSSKVSGAMEDGIEELILTFAAPVPVESVYLTLEGYRPGNGLDSYDDPLVFVLLTGGDVLTFSELNGIEEGNGQTGTLDLAALVNPGAMIESITVREIRRHVGLESLMFATVPTPGGIALLGLAGLLGRCSRRRAA